MTARRLMIAGNWKMYKTPKDTASFVEVLSSRLGSKELPVDVAISPPFINLETALDKRAKAPIQVVAQNMESREEGAYTGEVSPTMLDAVGVDGVIIGHSERRQYYNETDQSVNAKLLAALKHNLLPIVCVGESLKEREAGQTDNVVTRQVEAALSGISATEFNQLVIAYEPVWAIGTGQVCDATEANRVCAVIRNILATLADPTRSQQVRILYGGSMKPENAQELLGQSDIDGGLIGGASLSVDSFHQMIEYAISETTATCAA